MGTWHDLDLGRPIAAPLERCAELLGVDLATVGKLAAKVEPYLRAEGTRIWSLMQLERHLRPDAYGLVRGGYLARRRPRASGRHAQPDIRLGLHDLGLYPPMTPAEMRESLELLPSWVLAQKAAANRQLIAVMSQRLAASEQVARMYQEPGLAWLERQAEAAEQLLAERQAGEQN